MDDQRTDPEHSTSRDGSKGEISLTTAFDLLARRPRRQLLYWLHQRDEGVATLDALVRRLTESDATESTADDLEGLRISLHHVHLPRLQDAEIVDYDPDAGTVRYLGDPRLGDLLEWGIGEEALE